MESHKPNFACQQNHDWREPLTEDVNVLDIGMSEFINSNVVDMNNEHFLFTVSEALRSLSSDNRCDNKSLHAAGMVGLDQVIKNVIYLI